MTCQSTQSKSSSTQSEAELPEELLQIFQSIGEECLTIHEALSEPAFICDTPCKSGHEKQIKVPLFWEHSILRRESDVQMTCPNCLSNIRTMVQRRCTKATHLLALILLPVCLCMFPYFTKETKNTLHYCPSCHIYVGGYLGTVKDGIIVLFTPNPWDDFKV